MYSSDSESPYRMLKRLPLPAISEGQGLASFGPREARGLGISLPSALQKELPQEVRLGAVADAAAALGLTVVDIAVAQPEDQAEVFRGPMKKAVPFRRHFPSPSVL
jgi:hypothetical protein